MVVDVAVSEAKKIFNGLNKIIIYANDIVSYADLKLEEFTSLIENYGFIINKKKLALFIKKRKKLHCARHMSIV